MSDSGASSFDDEHEMLVYEMNGWDAGDREQLDMLLAAEKIPHQWEGDELLVPESEEERVDALMDRVEFPEELEAVTDSGVQDEAQYHVLSDLFDATDRLVGASVVNVDIAGDFVAAAGAIASAPVPFGVDARRWDQIREVAASLVGLIDEEVDDEVIVREGETLRSLLRPLV